MSYEELMAEMPKVIDDQQETIYLPLADYENAGLVRPSKDYFKVLPNAVLVPILEAFVPNLQEKTATENGPVTPDEGFYGLLKVTVDVPSDNQWRGVFKDGESYKVNEYVEYEENVYLCIKDTDGTQNPTNTEYWKMVNKGVNFYSIEVTPTKEEQRLIPEEGYDGFDEVVVNPIPDEYVIPNLQEKTVTENGDVTADEGYDGLSKVTVNVEGADGGGGTVLIVDGSTITIEAANVTAVDDNTISIGG